ncbi:adenosylcobinamide-phosphate synthase CbiB [Haladaptatus sp. AB643]|uniref:adenosylcobinamide-phosphate synthase CbiB n=1 Tax=Haladaptatus sp. AB643 TaxID=2934174 RepID=UPI00209BBD55|nr:adenosylcobinamide-phosphate synthase CbiB [Haladaptatus sp. AB643]MCO8245454.1 adenosylcobinamide-phosphate synthase CbiB [Haladaptatus sp. AB643]
MTLTPVVAVLLAFILDETIAEPPVCLHPVAWFGRVVGACDRSWRYPRLTGVLIACVFPFTAAIVAGVTITFLSQIAPTENVVSIVFLGCVAGMWLFATTSRRMLLDVAHGVLDDIETDPGRARNSIRALVGRDTTNLSPAELRSGAVESAAENLADGLVAPLLAFMVAAQFSLSMAVAAAVWVKAVNTLDSMLGYPAKPHGTASARLDDLVMWLPARVSAVLLSIAAGDLTAPTRAARWVDAPPSPNSGWPMATLATILNVRLTKPGVYTLNLDADLPADERAKRSVRIVDRAALVAFGFAGVVTWF